MAIPRHRLANPYARGQRRESHRGLQRVGPWGSRFRTSAELRGRQEEYAASRPKPVADLGPAWGRKHRIKTRHGIFSTIKDPGEERRLVGFTGSPRIQAEVERMRTGEPQVVEDIQGMMERLRGINQGTIPINMEQARRTGTMGPAYQPMMSVQDREQAREQRRRQMMNEAGIAGIIFQGLFG